MSDSVARLFVVLPVRGVVSGKSRLGEVLTASARESFNEWLIDHTLAAVRAWRGGLETCVVVSACERVLHIASASGADTLMEPAVSGLNAAASLGAQKAARLGATSVLVLPCDLPLLDASALEAFVLEGRGADAVIAPDKRGTGTNGLLVPAEEAPDFCFGEGSFERHFAAATARGWRVAVHRSQALGFDVDTAEDYVLWAATNGEAAAKPVV